MTESFSYVGCQPVVTRGHLRESDGVTESHRRLKSH